MSKQIVGVIIVIILIIGGWALFASNQDSASNSDNTENVLSENAIYELSFEDYNGSTVSLASERGEILIVNSWATWCPFCRTELPDFSIIQDEFPEVTVIAINRREGLDQSRQYTDDLVPAENIVFWLDRDDAFYRTIGGISMPETLFINGAGEVITHKRGVMDLDEMRRLTRDIVGERRSADFIELERTVVGCSGTHTDGEACVI